MPDLAANQMAFLVILIVVFGLLLTERLRPDIVAILTILALVISGVLSPEAALAGFSSEAAIVVAAIFVISHAIHQTGLSDVIGNWIGRLAGQQEGQATTVIMLLVALFSAFTHHLTTTAVMLPVTIRLGQERAIAPSKLLIPLSFAASLGTTITIIGAPAFLIASGVLQQANRPALGIFSIAPIGLSLTLLGTLFMLLVGRWLLPAHPSDETTTDLLRLDDYFTELTILPTSPFLDQTVTEASDNPRFRFRVVGLLREGKQHGGPLETERLQAGDVLLIRTSPDELVAIRQEAGVELSPVEQYGDGATTPGNDEEIGDKLVQAVVAPGSDLAGRTLSAIDFRRRYGAIVVGLWRKRGWLEQALSSVVLRSGDVLVLQGDELALQRVADDRSILMLMPFQGEARPRGRAAVAGGIMVATIVLAATNLLPIAIAALAGAAAMVLTRCITPRQAYRSIDARIYVFIAGALPLGAAMEESGTAELLGGLLRGVAEGWNHVLILFVLFGIVAILTQFMSDAATTAVFAPVAVALAQGLGMAPEPFVVTVAMAAVASFITPIGHHGNLLVYGPGRYHFADFVRVGTPLTLLIGVTVAFLAPVVWPG